MNSYVITTIVPIKQQQLNCKYKELSALKAHITKQA